MPPTTLSSGGFLFAWYSVAGAATKNASSVVVVTQDNTPGAVTSSLTAKYWSLDATSGTTTAPAANSNFYVSEYNATTGAFENYVTINSNNQKTSVTGTAAVQLEATLSGVSSLDTTVYKLTITVTYNDGAGTPAAGTGTVKYYASANTSSLASDATVLATTAQAMSAKANADAGVYEVEMSSTAGSNYSANVIIFVDGTANISYAAANFQVSAVLEAA